MLSKSLLPAFALLFLLSANTVSAQDDLPRGVPEKEGVQASAIMDFLNAAGHSHTEFHSFMFLRHGKVIAEGWWNPYSRTLKHTLYSTSKSFTAAAVGFALEEKKLKLTDKVISFFPNDLPDSVSQYLKELTVKDALMMSDGMTPDPSPKVSATANWVQTFLRTPIINEPGKVFLYNSVGTYMLSAIVTKVTGQAVLDYLRPRLFDPLSINGEDWETSPQGIDCGGWGLRLRTEDMAKFGQLYLNGGTWKGKRILPKEWVKEATTAQIIQDPSASQSNRDNSDWLQGYCFQMWRCRHNGVRADGAFGQFIIMLPDQDAVVAITAETPNMQEEINLVWQYLLPSMQGWAYKDDPEADEKLKEQLASLALPPLKGAATAADPSINGRTYALQSNDRKLQSVHFSFQDGKWLLTLKTDTASYTLPFDDSKWAITQTSRKGPMLTDHAVNSEAGITSFLTAGSYHWIDENTLELELRYIESPHTETMTCHFDGDNIKIESKFSFEYGKAATVLTGSAQ